MLHYNYLYRWVIKLNVFFQKCNNIQNEVVAETTSVWLNLAKHLIVREQKNLDIEFSSLPFIRKET